jgi:DNA (cytosine-5)-methyltransferase 1
MPRKSINQPLRVASFFAGIGGFDLGFERAGMNVVFQCEIDKFCQSILKEHWPAVPLHGDIKTLRNEEIPQADIWAGGFPCQDVSLANQGKRKGLAGERSGLFHVYAELVKKSKPKWVILENVPGLLNSNKGEDFRTVISTLGELGYSVSWRVLDAKYFGTPQRRRRVYIVGSLGNESAFEVLFEPGPNQIVHRSALGAKDISSEEFPQSDESSSIFAIQHAAIGRKHTAGPGAKGFRNDGETYTLDSRGSADVVCSTIDAFGVRTPSGVSSELDSKRYRAVGNAVCVNVIEWIAGRIAAVAMASK